MKVKGNHFSEKDYDKNTFDKSLFKLLAPSVFGVIICLICLISATWAWYTDSSEVNKIEIKSAEYTVKVSIADSSGNELVSSDKGSYTLSTGNYFVTMQATGTSKYTSGYCTFVLCGDNYYTPQLRTTDSDLNLPSDFSFNLALNESVNVSFSSSWGTCSSSTRLVQGGTLTYGAASAESYSNNTNVNDSDSMSQNQPNTEPETQMPENSTESASES